LLQVEDQVFIRMPSAGKRKLFERHAGMEFPKSLALELDAERPQNGDSAPVRSEPRAGDPQQSVPNAGSGLKQDADQN
jgi:hypothetical protein